MFFIPYFRNCSGCIISRCFMTTVHCRARSDIENDGGDLSRKETVCRFKEDLHEIDGAETEHIAFECASIDRVHCIIDGDEGMERGSETVAICIESTNGTGKSNGFNVSIWCRVCMATKDLERAQTIYTQILAVDGNHGRSGRVYERLIALCKQRLLSLDKESEQKKRKEIESEYERYCTLWVDTEPFNKQSYFGFIEYLLLMEDWKRIKALWTKWME